MLRHTVRRGLAVFVCAASLLLATPAAAADALFRFDIAREPLSAALVDLATTAGVSISTRAARACAAQGQPVAGRYTVSEALARLLEGTGCSFRFIDKGAVEIRPAARAVRTGAAPVGIPEARTNDLDELIVVATRRATAADRLAYAVSSQDGATMAGLGVKDDGDLASTEPAMTVTNLGPGRDKILLRGLSDGPLTGRTQSMVGIYLDDVRLTYNAPDPDLKLVDMAQVEVLRGPQGALYGAGSLGGVLHLASAQPDRLSFGGWVSATVGATEHGAGSDGIEGVLNLPLFNGRGAARIVAYRDDDGGYINDTALNLRHVNQSTRQGVRLSTDFDLTEVWTVSAGVVGQAINSADTQYELAGQPAFSRNVALQEPHDNDFSEAHVGVAGRLDWADVKWTTALVSHHITSRYDATSDPPVPVPSGPAAFDDSDGIRSLVSEATFTSKDDAPVQWLGGLFFSHSIQTVDLKLTSLATANPLLAFKEARRDRLDEGAAFGETIWPLSTLLSLTLGGRLFTSTSHVSSAIQAPLNGTQSSFTGGVAHLGFAPKIVLSYARSPNVLLYLQAAEGYRSGGVNTTGVPGQAFDPAGGVEPNRYYSGDELWNLEAGLRASSLDGRLVVRAAAFEAIWQNIQSDELLPSGLPFTANIGDGRNTGVEFEGRYSDGPLVLRMNFLVNAPELDHANPEFPTRSESGLAGVPDASGGASAHYSWPLSANRSFELDGRYAYVGRSHLTFDEVISPRMGGYATGRLAASVATLSWRLTLAVDNPADERGNTFAYGNPFTLRTTQQITPLRPRTVSVSVRTAF
ncbi:TonB-dependent receptor [Phenylobacterium sp.]|uniref:TonB-dependent receptor domain-containing protein n=1 Tax=Phenylobacterium sp. TaxID=1871053 RepID=UPI0011FE5F58|nr:TonB-dependent receptor [Phenylobacterium sp.]THD51086.1 MAG: TonB-dependent receptor [Phenylobacterium sp.]